jgi:hypothetical protein
VDNVLRHPAPQQADDHAPVERLPPADVAAEQAVLGAMLLDPRIVEDVIEAVDADDFYRLQHATIFRAIAGAHVIGEDLSPNLLAAKLRKTGDLDRVGGTSYLNQLVNLAGLTSLAEGHALLVHETAVRRRILAELDGAAYRIRTGDGDVTEVAAAALDALNAATQHHGAAGHLAAALLDWPTFFATDFGTIDLLPGRLMAPGQQITVVGDGKAGKSLLVQEWAWRMATGQAFLGDKPGTPVRILYLDAENGQEQVQERFLSFGAHPRNMGSLHYASFPPVRPLDTAGGGADLMALVKSTRSELVVIDTVSRFISGPENDADTWLSLYRHTLLPLKRDGIGSVRLDHLGKDGERGARGSSAKTQDVDHVWELRAQGGGVLTLRRTHTRTGIGPDDFTILRKARRDGDSWLAGGTAHVLMTYDPTEQNIPGSDEEIIRRLDAAGVPLSAGNRVVKAKLADLQIAAGSDKVSRVVKARQKRANSDAANVPPQRSPDPFPETFPGNVPRNASQDGNGAGQTFPGNAAGTPGTPPVPPVPPSKEGDGEGTPEQDNSESTALCTLCGHPITNPDRIHRGYDTHLVCPTGEIPED